MARMGTNLAHKGKYSSTHTGHLRAQARASSNHYSLVRPIVSTLWLTPLNRKISTIFVAVKKKKMKSKRFSSKSHFSAILGKISEPILTKF